MKKNINIFLIGTGKVGKAFLKYISGYKILKIKGNLFNLRFVGIANRSSMLLSKNGIRLSDWQSQLTSKGIPTEIEIFISKMKEMKLPNSIFVDCTDGNEIAYYYHTILQSIPIVTPNKSANSDNYKKYISLKKIVKKFNTDFRYSANVGVGLPTLDILKSLIIGGDNIIAIEGLFSSTMNYLLDQLLTTDKKFSELLKEANEKGLTEPDPRNDLNGIDTARKLLILARESGTKIEMDDIVVENLVPVILRNINSLNNFYDSIKIYDGKFDELKKKALRCKSKLVYSASYNKKSASVKIKIVNKNHPFYSASANEKVVLIYSEFYKNFPLVIKGTSGGAEATARVLVSDILKIVNKKQHTD